MICWFFPFPEQIIFVIYKAIPFESCSVVKLWSIFRNAKGNFCIRVVHQAGAYPGLCSMKYSSPLPRMLVHPRFPPPPAFNKRAGTCLNTWVKRDTSIVSLSRTQHNVEPRGSLETSTLTILGHRAFTFWVTKPLTVWIFWKTDTEESAHVYVASFPFYSYFKA